MNIYCVIFMCTFGSNNTDTEIASPNSLIGNSTTIKDLRNTQNGKDLASMILPERGEPVPQPGDIVMELPDMPKHLTHGSTASQRKPTQSSSFKTATTSTDETGPTLTDILLPPALRRNLH